ncbi:transcription termination factor Rho [Corynebacterium bovis]|uniref:transcription termination factor Rho n=1 Tax=Corynebacterium bovis TaxID=36808 RepID=UPI00264FB41F|nr:transcription termination factor Rho [Corynebacterium bovis]MDN8579405.1 transcription termination factor Rho [Corynebacterium bovis]
MSLPDSLPDIVSRAQSGGLASLKLTELRQIASARGLKRISALRKGELITAISEAGGPGGAPARGAAGGTPDRAEEPAPERVRTHPERTAAAVEQDPNQDPNQDVRQNVNDGANETPASGPSHGGGDGRDDDRSVDQREERRGRSGRNQDRAQGDRNQGGRGQRDDRRDDRQDGSRDGQGGGGRRNRRNRRDRRRNRGGDNQGGQSSQNGNGNNGGGNGGGDNGGSRRGRGRNNGGNGGNNNGGNANGSGDSGGDSQQTTPVAGILDFADANTAFIRTTGYHPGPTDVYVPIQMVRRYGMRHGDAVTGAIRPKATAAPQSGGQGGRGRNRQKYTPLHSVNTVNGLTPDEAAQRPHFSRLTPLYPNQRMRLETDPKIITTRVIDLIMPIGKGQRALIVSPPKAGKTTILQDIANAIAINNPECYLMVVLVDERPEEVTDMQRSVHGEVIASTFDRPPGEHTAIAELAIERAKRLVEQGKDVVVLLDSITRLGRAYNNSSPASGRILSGGVDSNALYPPKKFLGAARNIENGGSLTIIATAMVETGSAGDTVIFEEFKGTGNAELKLDRKISERRVFPAVDVNPSGTRKDDLLLGPEEARLMHRLRRILSALDNQAAIDLLIKQLRKHKTNREFMLQVATSAPMATDEDED